MIFLCIGKQVFQFSPCKQCNQILEFCMNRYKNKLILVVGIIHCLPSGFNVPVLRISVPVPETYWGICICKIELYQLPEKAFSVETSHLLLQVY